MSAGIGLIASRARSCTRAACGTRPACLGGRPEPTVGHWPSDDPFGERRIDTVRVTREVVPALRSIETVRTALTLAASDHLPVVVTFDTDQIAAR